VNQRPGEVKLLPAQDVQKHSNTARIMVYVTYNKLSLVRAFIFITIMVVVNTSFSGYKLPVGAMVIYYSPKIYLCCLKLSIMSY
jgi:hypothetical protein